VRTARSEAGADGEVGGWSERRGRRRERTARSGEGAGAGGPWARMARLGAGAGAGGEVRGRSGGGELGRRRWWNLAA
jgi:hypothetical protein